MSNHRFPVPNQIPGRPVRERQWVQSLKEKLQQLCLTHNTRFPGSQPVSFEKTSLDVLENEDFWVCEKSDGVRVLVMIVVNAAGQQEVFLVDRKEDFYQVYNISVPRWDNLREPLDNTVLDGELVIDVDPYSKKHTLRLLVFDCLVVNGENLMHKSLQSRYGRLKAFVVGPHLGELQRAPQLAKDMPFHIAIKPQELAYGIEAVFKTHLPKLMHGNDGLIFTSAEAKYTPGTDPKIMKWKPPNENSIDFLLQLRFPPDAADQPDLHAMPLFLLMMNLGGGQVDFFDFLEVYPQEWEDMKAAGTQYDDRIVEVVWDREEKRWKMLRFRDDKREGNFHEIVYKILNSIKDGVEAETLIARAATIRTKWKERAAQRAGLPPPPPSSSTPSESKSHSQSKTNGSHPPPSAPVEGAGTAGTAAVLAEGPKLTMCYPRTADGGPRPKWTPSGAGGPAGWKGRLEGVIVP